MYNIINKISGTIISVIIPIVVFFSFDFFYTIFYHSNLLISLNDYTTGIYILKINIQLIPIYLILYLAFKFYKNNKILITILFVIILFIFSVIFARTLYDIAIYTYETKQYDLGGAEFFPGLVFIFDLPICTLLIGIFFDIIKNIGSTKKNPIYVFFSFILFVLLINIFTIDII